MNHSNTIIKIPGYLSFIAKSFRKYHLIQKEPDVLEQEYCESKRDEEKLEEKLRKTPDETRGNSETDETDETRGNFF